MGYCSRHPPYSGRGKKGQINCLSFPMIALRNAFLREYQHPITTRNCLRIHVGALKSAYRLKNPLVYILVHRYDYRVILICKTPVSKVKRVERYRNKTIKTNSV